MGIKFSKVDFTYNKNKNNIVNVNNDIDINIENNDEFIAIVGHTGSGKSTLVQLMNSLLIPTSGEIDIDYIDKGNDNTKAYYHIKGDLKKPKYSYSLNSDKVKYKSRVILKPLRRHIGLVFQFPEYQIFEETVLKDIMFGPKNFLKNESDAEAEARKIAEMIGITKLLDKSPFALSGGQMRKVAIAGILASNPDILVLDEPTVGLDPLTKEELLQFLKKLNEETHKSIILITHDMDVVCKYAKRVIVLNKGEVKYDGLKTELFKNEEIIKSCDLNYPNIVKIMMGLKEKLNIDFDVFQYTIEDAYKEIKSKVGGSNER